MLKSRRIIYREENTELFATGLHLHSRFQFEINIRYGLHTLGVYLCLAAVSRVL